MKTREESKLEKVRVEELKPYAKNARVHSPKQVTEIARSIRVFGFTNPVLVDQNNMIIAGHGRVMAAKELGLEEVPVIRIEYLSEAEKRAYILADNKLAEKAGWDKEILAIELQELLVIEEDFDITLTGFAPCEDNKNPRGGLNFGYRCGRGRCHGRIPR
ncbi:MAG: ParB/Srx family N-terminal domain-containing protein [Brevinema sp.]